MQARAAANSPSNPSPMLDESLSGSLAAGKREEGNNDMRSVSKVRCFLALMNKNFQLKRKSPWVCCCELLLPVLALLLLGVVAPSDELVLESVPTQSFEVPSFSYLTGQSRPGENMLCFDNSLMYRCGCHVSSDDWSIPDVYITNGMNHTVVELWTTSHSGGLLREFCFQMWGGILQGKETQDEVEVPELLSSAGVSACDIVQDVTDFCPPFTTAMNGLIADCGAEVSTETDPSLLDARINTFIQTYGSAAVIPEESVEDVCSQQLIALMPYKEDCEGDDACEAAKGFAAFLSSEEPDVASHLRTYSSEAEFNAYVDLKDYSQGPNFDLYSAAVVFNQGSAESPQWDYTLRLNYTHAAFEDDSGYYDRNVPSTQQTFDIALRYAADTQSSDDGTGFHPAAQSYYISGALTLQQAVDQFVVYESSGNTVRGTPTYRISDFPNAEYSSNTFWASVGTFFAILLTLVLIYPVMNVIKSLVWEKETKIKEGMLQMGLSSGVYTASWVAWFTLVWFFLAAIMTTVGAGIFENSSKVLVFLWFFFFLEAVLALCFFVSTFFSRAKSAATYGALIFFMTLLPYFSVTSDSSASTLQACCLVPTSCFAIGTIPLAEFEDAGLGITQDTVGDVGESNISFSTVLQYLLIDVVIYSLLAWYAQKVVPSEWGTSLRWYFPFQASYWCPKRTARQSLDTMRSEVMNDEGSRGDAHMQAVSEQLRRQLATDKCVVMRGLRKTFKSPTTGAEFEAVKGLDMTMYRGQITALLGHNGAGKTTTMNMLTGMVPVTSGTGLVQGLDINTQMATIRGGLGVCPQHDILFNELSVRQHLRMYATFKGVRPGKGKGEMDEEVDAMIKAVGLTEKTMERTEGLSGGQKRKLSVAIAFIGGSKTVLLDEPTSGMDPFSRRFTWNVIRRFREGRVIVLTTHFMDEADLLGDRIAIMAHGELKCMGSSLFLKNLYGVGYNFVLVKKVEEDQSKDANQREELTRLITSHVPRAKLVSSVGAEMSFQLPTESASKFEGMLLEVEQNMGSLDVTSYGMGITTLEEVFLRVARGASDENTQSLRKSLSAAQGEEESKKDEEALVKSKSKGLREETSSDGVKKPGPLPEGVDPQRAAANPLVLSTQQRFWRHNKALLVKRFVTFKRDRKALCFAIFAPAFFILMGMLILLLTATKDQPRLELRLAADYNSDLPLAERLPLMYPEATCMDETAVCDIDDFVAALPTEEREGSGGTATTPLGIALEPRDAVEGGSDAVESLATLLLAEQGDLEASRYAAFTFEELDNDGTETLVADVNVLCNYTALHAAPTYLNLVGNTVLRMVTGTEEVGEGEASISVAMHPFARTKYEKEFDREADSLSTIIFTLLGFAFIPAAWAGFVVRERENRSKHQQIVSGVSRMAYWTSTYLWDVGVFLFTPCFALALLSAFDTSALFKGGAAWPLALLFFLFGPASAGFTYTTSFYFRSYASSMTATLIMNWVLGLVFGLVSFILLILPSSRKYIRIIRWILRILPPFALAEGMFNIGTRQILAFIYGVQSLSPWDMNVAGADILYLAAEIVIYFFTTIGLEFFLSGTGTVSSFFSGLTLNRRIAKQDPKELWDGDLLQQQQQQQQQLATITTENNTTSGEDEDVVAERKRVMAMNEALSGEHYPWRGEGTAVERVEEGMGGKVDLGPDGKGDVISINGLRKAYPRADGGLKVAVRNQWLGIPKGEVFGLLGINGAGKTTTLGMLSGEVMPTEGRGFLAGIDVSKHPDQVHRLIGYCPQFDALFHTMTAREHLTLYANIKGIPPDCVEDVVSAKIVQMDLSLYADKLAGGYSGGNRRKLSVAIAMIGSPELVMLDEPSTGVDPVARRFMWEVISQVVTANKEAALVLTTHSMEECEALCQRIGIMVGGRLKCLGSAQHLKSRFGQGYQLEITVNEPTEQEVLQESEQLWTAAGAPRGGFKEDHELKSDEVTRALTRHPILAPSICPGGEGNEIYEELSNYGSTKVLDLATWCLVELRVNRVKAFMLGGSDLIGCSVLEKQKGKVRFLIPKQPDLSLGSIFGIVERSHTELGVNEYSLGQTSLEQIFNGFASQQNEEKATAPGLGQVVGGALPASPDSTNSVKATARSSTGAGRATAVVAPSEEKEEG